MDGLMMDYPLVLPCLLRRASRLFAEKEIVSRMGDGSLHRSNYGALCARVARLMNALRDLGIRPGDRVATFAWNHHRHLELYFAVPALGAVLHTINVRLPREQIHYIINHAEDRLIFCDRSLSAPIAALRGTIPTVRGIILMDDRGTVPDDLPDRPLDYEHVLDAASPREEFPEFDENAAAGLCYTSGTTGEPKGVLYSHRALVLHALAGTMVDGAAIGEREVVLPVVPMFHVNAWGLPYTATLAGATLAFPGPFMVDQPLAELIESERVTFASGVPTVWNRLHHYLQQNPHHDLSSLHTIVVGGSAASRTLIENYERDLGIRVIHAWGMTELSPVGTFCRPKRAMESLPQDELMQIRCKQGTPAPCVELRLMGAGGEDVPWDGEQAGELLVRGVWVASRYYKNDEADAAFTDDGWFRTGDIATIDPQGYVQITDRKKDLIKRKGEWISSVDMENALLGHPGVLEAAVVGRPDPICDEVPVAFIVRREADGRPIPVAEIVELLKARFAPWQVPRPDDVRFVASLPKTSVGKLDKKVLRRELAEAPAVPECSSD